MASFIDLFAIPLTLTKGVSRSPSSSVSSTCIPIGMEIAVQANEARNIEGQCHLAIHPIVSLLAACWSAIQRVLKSTGGAGGGARASEEGAVEDEGGVSVSNHCCINIISLRDDMMYS